jgi:hypothetical protein
MVAKLILGHGAEKTQAFEERKRIPPGYTLVTYAQCGSVTYSDTVAELVKAFGNPANKEILENPTTNALKLKHALNGLDTHVYTEGMYYPEATIYLFTYWKDDAYEVKNIQKDDQIAITKSGVFEYPLNMDTWNLRPELGDNYTTKSMFTTVDLKNKRSSFGPMQIKNAEEVATKSYTDSIFPTPQEVISLLETVKNNVEKFEAATKHSLETIFEKGGPGVYYHFVCREPMDVGLSYYTQSFGENAGFPNHKYEKSYHINNIPTLMPYMQSFAATRHEKFKQSLKKILAQKKQHLTDAELTEMANTLRNSPNAKNRYGLTDSDMFSLFSWNYSNIVKAPAKFQRAYNMIHRTRRMSINQQARNRAPKSKKCNKKDGWCGIMGGARSRRRRS